MPKETKKAVKEKQAVKNKLAETADVDISEMEDNIREAAEYVTNTKKTKKRVVVNDDARDTCAILNGSKQSMTILSGTLECLEFEENYKNPEVAICGVTSFEGFKILIPAGHMGLDMSQGDDGRGMNYKRFINAMLGSRVEYVVLGVDAEHKFAVASRRLAMEIRRKQYYLTQRQEGKSLMQAACDRKTPVKANVIAVSGSLVRLNVHGVDCKVFAKEASWRYVSDLSTLFCPGDSVNVLVRKIDIEPKSNRVTLDVSIREATENHQAKNAARYKPDSICIGTVTGATTKGYYIALGDTDTGIDAFCNLVHGTVAPQVGDRVVCQLLHVDTEKGYATAKITRIMQKGK